MISSINVQVNSRNVKKVEIIPSERCDKHYTSSLSLVKNRVKDIHDLVHIIRLHKHHNTWPTAGLTTKYLTGVYLTLSYVSAQHLTVVVLIKMLKCSLLQCP